MRNSLLLILALTALLLTACGEAPVPADPPGTTASDSPAAFLDAQGGKVVVIVMGMEGCAKTMAASKALVAMAPGLPDDVTVARIDAPPPGGTVDAVEGWAHPCFYGVDDEREVADRLDFFFYPTVYVLDREGSVRFAGGMEAAKLREMVDAVRAEKPGDEKHVYTAPLVPIGDTGPTIGDFEFERDGPTLVFFNSVTCPFSTQALKALVDVELFFGAHDIQYVIVETSKNGERAKRLHEDGDMTGDFVHDAKGSIAVAYGVGAAPFFYVIDDTGTVTARAPYTPLAARKALGALLGVTVGAAPGEQAGGAG